MNDQLQRLLPRYIRINGLSFEDCDEVVINSHVSALKRLLGLDTVHGVKWVPGFIAVPGYVGLAALNSHPNYFPMDISSGYVVLRSGIGSMDSSGDSALSRSEGGSHYYGRSFLSAKSVLDLCCCPGGKYMAIADQLQGRGQSDRLLVGVDVSEIRMQTCKALVSKNMSHLYQIPRSAVQSGPQDGVIGRRPRLLLFRADGTSFDSASPGDLVFDSAVHFSDIITINNAPPDDFDPSSDASGARASRKRKNKSYRGRERQRLRAAAEALLLAASHSSSSKASPKCPMHSNEAIHGAASIDDPGDDQDDQCIVTVNAFSGFDVVFVDAECSHDGSYRHLAALETVDSVVPSSWECVTHSEGVNRSNTGSWSVSVESLCGCAVGESRVGCSDRSSDRSLNPGRVYVKRDRYSTRDESAIVDLQKRLISHGFDLLRPGGVLMYSTCSLSPNQNQGVVRHLLKHHPNAQLVPITDDPDDAQSIANSSQITLASNTKGINSEGRLSYSGASLFEALSLSDEELALFLKSLSSDDDIMKCAADRLCEYIASMTQAPRNCFQRPVDSKGTGGCSGTSDRGGKFADGELADSRAPLQGTVQFQRSCGTSGLFAAKIKKKIDN